MERPMRFPISPCARRYGPAALAVIIASTLSVSNFRASAADKPGADDACCDLPLASDVRGLDGQKLSLTAPRGGATVLVFYSSECPISNAYSGTLNALADEFRGGRLNLVGLCADPDLTDAQVAEHGREFGLTFPLVRDRHGKIAAAVGAKVTPEAFVIDDRGEVRYRGRIDDQYVARRVRNAHPETHDLRDAVRAVLDGRAVAKANLPAVGCPLPEPPREAATPTYARDVAPILQRSCQTCHRPGQVGPFSLMTYEQARKRADDIADVVGERRMPPWKPTPGVGPKFKHDKSLTEDEVAAVVAWAEAGAPEGDPADMPPPASFSEDWSLGTPDLVLQPASDFEIPANGADIYRCFVIPTDLPKDMYISAVEFRPSNHRVVHHVLCYVDTTGEARKRDEADPGEGYSCFSGPGVEIHGDLGGWAPGNEPNFLPEGVGRSLPKKADVIMQVHYHPSGKPETDRTRIGVYFARKPVKQILHWGAALDPRLKLPPNRKDIEVKGEWPIPVDVVAYAVTPHMHLLGRDIAMSVKYPDGRTEDLIKIDDWDFNWQNTYYFKEPLHLPKGTVLNVVSHYDNTDKNPRNPNKPPVEVRWGEATTDEMCIGFLGITKQGQDLTRPGEKDDLLEYFRKQRQEFERRSREASEKNKKEKADG